jgi:hypothetical protein
LSSFFANRLQFMFADVTLRFTAMQNTWKCYCFDVVWGRCDDNSRTEQFQGIPEIIVIIISCWISVLFSWQIKFYMFGMFTCYWRTNWMAEFRFPGEYCYILNQYYLIMSLRHTRSPVQQIPIKVFPRVSRWLSGWCNRLFCCLYLFRYCMKKVIINWRKLR